MHGGSSLLVRLLAACVTLAGCGGPALLKEAQPRESSKPVAEGKDARILAAIDTIIVRNGADTWARDVEWDEYLIRIRSLSDEPVEITGIAIFDALDYRIQPRSHRGELLDGTRETERRYEQSGKLVRSRGVDGWVVAAVGLAGATAIAASASSNAGFLAGGGRGAAAGGVIVVGGAMLAVAGVARLVENAQVDSEIQRRRTTLPVALPGGAQAHVDLFFPIAPQSGRTQIVYTDRHGEHRLDVDTRHARVELERPPTLVFRVDPDFPDQARRTSVGEGHVKALLTLDRRGRVQGVDVIESVPLGVFNQEARRTFGRWKYCEGHFDGRTVEATLEFRR